MELLYHRHRDLNLEGWCRRDESKVAAATKPSGLPGLDLQQFFNIMDLMLPILSVLGYWAVVLGALDVPST